jgi:peptidoglycan/LPS O-acetylase OafA/YrhL
VNNNSDAESRFYRPDIDGLRALAILPVILYHAKIGCPGGFVGVDVFFVISGFLITSLIIKEQNKGEFTLISFWERRIRRILPAIATVVFASIVAGWFVFAPVDLEQLGKSVVAQSALLANVFFYRQSCVGGGYFDPGSDAKTLLHTWSLAVEEQFYLSFPLLLVLLGKNRSNTRTLLIFCIAVASLALSVVGSYRYAGAAFYLLPTRAWELLLGSLAALMQGRLTADRLVAHLLGCWGIVLIFCGVVFYNKETRFPGLAAVLPCMGAWLIIISSDSRPSSVGKILSLKPLVFIGLISYSLYLWHWPLLVFLQYLDFNKDSETFVFRAALLVVSGLLATLSWKYIETPFRQRRVLKKTSQVFTFAGAVFVALFLSGIFLFRSHGVPSRLSRKGLEIYKSQTQVASLSQNQKAFLNDVSLDQAVQGQFPEIGSGNSNAPVSFLVWGDSHATAITPVIDTLCGRFGRRGVVAVHFSTPPTLGYAGYGGKYGLNERAPLFGKAVLNYIFHKTVKNVIVVSFWSDYPQPDLLQSNLISTIQSLLNTGAHVYVLKDVPIQRKDLSHLMALASMHPDILQKIAVTQQQHVARNRAFASTFYRISSMGATVLDPAQFFLNAEQLYGVMKDDQILYKDYNHINEQGAHLLEPLFAPIFSTSNVMSQKTVYWR